MVSLFRRIAGLHFHFHDPRVGKVRRFAEQTDSLGLVQHKPRASYMHSHILDVCIDTVLGPLFKVLAQLSIHSYTMREVANMMTICESR